MKVARHEKIIELIHQYDIDTQEELASRLNEAGFKVTQATVSRDIRALKLTKVAGKDGKSRYAIINNESGSLGEKYTRVLEDTLLSIDVGQNVLRKQQLLMNHRQNRLKQLRKSILSRLLNSLLQSRNLLAYQKV